MVMRCTNAKQADYKYYGGRGITVCERWRESFGFFLADMGERPSSLHSIDRIDNTRGYEPGNCRWATKEQQMQNTRSTRLITFAGETMGLTAWARKLGLSKESFRFRLLNWPLNEAITRPAKTNRRKCQRAMNGEES